jgi:1-acyl-sn-glycerol-3-phosphate acyltransferase
MRRLKEMTPMQSQPGELDRDVLIDAILDFLADQDLLTRQDIRAALQREIDRAGPDALHALKERLLADTGWDFYPRDPLAQSIHHLLAARFLAEGSELRDQHYAIDLADAPLVIVANHLSYSDANVIEILLQQGGAAGPANRLTALAGPKVFTSRERRFSSLCFGTVKVPQSAEVSSGEAALNNREVARAARRSIDVALDRLRAGDVLLLFGEGTRSRTAEMQQMLAGVARYLDVPATLVLPLGLSGSEALYPVDKTTIHPSRVVAQLGRPLRADALLGRAGGDRRLVMDAIGLAIAEVLPPQYRGAYANAGNLSDAAGVLRDARVQA